MGTFMYRKLDGSYAIPDKKAPRFKRATYSPLNIELFKRFRKAHPNSPIDTWAKFRSLVIAGNDIYRQFVVTNRNGIELPNQIGNMFIGACPRKKDDNPDAILSQRLGIKVQNKNWETSQYLCKIFYSSYMTKYKFPLRKYWYFKAARVFKQESSKSFLTNWNYYIKVSPFQKLSIQQKMDNFRTIKVNKYESKRGRVDFSDTQPE